MKSLFAILLASSILLANCTSQSEEQVVEKSESESSVIVQTKIEDDKIFYQLAESDEFQELIISDQIKDKYSRCVSLGPDGLGSDNLNYGVEIISDGRFLTVELGCIEALAILIYDPQTKILHDAGSFAANVKWSDGKIVIIHSGIYDNFNIRASVSAETPWIIPESACPELNEIAIYLIQKEDAYNNFDGIYSKEHEEYLQSLVAKDQSYATLVKEMHSRTPLQGKTKHMANTSPMAELILKAYLAGDCSV